MYVSGGSSENRTCFLTVLDDDDDDDVAYIGCLRGIRCDGCRDMEEDDMGVDEEHAGRGSTGLRREYC